MIKFSMVDPPPHPCTSAAEAIDDVVKQSFPSYLNFPLALTVSLTK